MKKLNIIFFAHEVSPFQGSECGQAWNLILELSNLANLIVIHSRSNQKGNIIYSNQISLYLKSSKIYKNVIFNDVSYPIYARLIIKLNYFIFGKIGSIGLPILYYLAYKIWLKKAYKIVKKIIDKGNIDLIYHKNLMSFRVPGLFKEINIPIVWGPISGTDNVPFKIIISLKLKYAILELIRNFANYFQMTFSYKLKKSIKRADLIYVVSDSDYNFIKKSGAQRIKYKIEGGTYNNIIKNKNYNTKLKLLWVGQLIPRKNLQVLLEVFKNSEIIRKETTLNVLGDGPLMKNYKDYINKNCIYNINLMGNQPHSHVLNVMNESDLFIHTSYNEATSQVVLEALSNGLPVICHDICGMTKVIDEKCGIKIPLISNKISIKLFKREIENLIINKKRLESLKIGAKNKSKILTWENMARELIDDFNKILDINENTPNK